MEIKITAKKNRLDFEKKDSKLGSIKAATEERYFPFLELMMKELKNEQEQMRSKR